jgi:hypothetical protein
MPLPRIKEGKEDAAVRSDEAPYARKPARRKSLLSQTMAAAAAGAGTDADADRVGGPGGEATDPPAPAAGAAALSPKMSKSKQRMARRKSSSFNAGAAARIAGASGATLLEAEAILKAEADAAAEVAAAAADPEHAAALALATAGAGANWDKKPNAFRHMGRLDDMGVVLPQKVTWLQLWARNHDYCYVQRAAHVAEVMGQIQLTQMAIKSSMAFVVGNASTVRQVAWMSWAQPTLAALRAALDEITALVEGLVTVFKSRAEDRIAALCVTAKDAIAHLLENELLGHGPALELDDPEACAFWCEVVGNVQSIELPLLEQCVALALQEGRLWACGVGPVAGRNVAKAMRLEISGQHGHDAVTCTAFGQWLGQSTRHGSDALGQRVRRLVRHDCAEGLVELFSRFNGERWARRDGWMLADDFGEWFGVATDAVHGVPLRLTLPSNGVRAAAVGHGGSGGGATTPGLPTYVFQFMTLVRIDLSGNGMEGALPRELGGPTMAPCLEELCLHNNKIGGRLPPPLATSQCLRALYLHNNQLAGALPSRWAAPRLAHVHLFNNRLSGKIPAALGSGLPRLSSLRLGGNALTGPVPASLGACAGTLASLQLERNQLTGAPPAELSQLTQLRYLDLSHNKVRPCDFDFSLLLRLAHSLTHSLTHTLTHPLTHSQTPPRLLVSRSPLSRTSSLLTRQDARRRAHPRDAARRCAVAAHVPAQAQPGIPGARHAAGGGVDGRHGRGAAGPSGDRGGGGRGGGGGGRGARGGGVRATGCDAGGVRGGDGGEEGGALGTAARRAGGRGGAAAPRVSARDLRGGPGRRRRTGG